MEKEFWYCNIPFKTVSLNPICLEIIVQRDNETMLEFNRRVAAHRMTHIIAGDIPPDGV